MCDDDDEDSFIKILAILSGVCTTFTYAILLWFTICRENRLKKSDEEIKRKALSKLKREKLKRIKSISQK